MGEDSPAAACLNCFHRGTDHSTGYCFWRKSTFKNVPQSLWQERSFAYQKDTKHHIDACGIGNQLFGNFAYGIGTLQKSQADKNHQHQTQCQWGKRPLRNNTPNTGDNGIDLSQISYAKAGEGTTDAV